MAAATQEAHAQDHGGLSNAMLGFYLFLASEVMFFAGLFAAYFVARADAEEWPPDYLLSPEKIADGVHLELELPLALIGTIILVASSVVVQLAVMAIKRGNQTGFLWAMFIAVTMGLIFLGIQLYDYTQLSFGADDTVYGSTFYVLTGFHGAHVAGGVLFMSIVLFRGLGGQFSAKHHDAVEASSMYWHFVDVIWIGLFSLLYLVPA